MAARKRVAKVLDLDMDAVRAEANASKGERAAAAVAAYCRSRSYPEPETEVRFHPARKWRWDCAWPARRLAVEFQGGVWVAGGGGHTRGREYENDCEKLSAAAVLGWRVMLVTYRQFDAGNLWALLDREFGGEESTPA